MKVIEIIGFIGFIINMVTAFIQLPYLYIAGITMGWSYRPGIGSKAIYGWYPTEGVFKLHMNPDGYTVSDIITYKELFN